MEAIAAMKARCRGRRDESVDNPRAMRPLACGIIAIVCAAAAVVITGFEVTTNQQSRLHKAQSANQELRAVLVALIDAETGVRGYVITGKPEYLEPFHSGSQILDTIATDRLEEVDSFAKAEARSAIPSESIRELRRAWNWALAQAERGSLGTAQADLETSHSKVLMDDLRRSIGGVLTLHERENESDWQRIGTEQGWVILLDLIGAVVAIAALVFAFDRAIRDAARRLHAVRDGAKAARQIKLLLVMAEMLQGAVDRDDANEVLRGSAMQLLPELDGALYVLNSSRDRLDLSTTWKGPSSDTTEQSWLGHIAPASCWALKRGKAHLSDNGPGALRCAHARGDDASLGIPMSARGEVYGLLEVTTTGADAGVRLAAARPLAAALADSMSLALSSISLREKLRNQALRDPLTGLYNRRFLEEMLERIAADSERRRASFSAVMLDLDHFKALNDRFGHATGDAVLRQVANVILATIRNTDVACRYGGEEIALLMPDCDLEMALAKAELIRVAVENASSDGRLPAVTASLGIASIPETCGRPEDLLSAADAALYEAKNQGRNKSAAAPVRMHGPILVRAS